MAPKRVSAKSPSAKAPGAKAKGRSPARAKAKAARGSEPEVAAPEVAAAPDLALPVLQAEELEPLALATPLDIEAACWRTELSSGRVDAEARKVERVLLNCLVTEDLASVDIRVLEIAVLDARAAGGAVDADLLARAERCLEEATEVQAAPEEEELEEPTELIEKLFDAINDFDAEVVQECLDANAGTPSQLPVDVTDHEGNTPLSEAACYGVDDVVQLVLARRAHPDRRNSQGRTPLWRACYNGHLAVVELLLQNGADKDIPNNQMEAPGKFGTPETKAAVANWDSQRTVEIKRELGIRVLDHTEESLTSWMTSQGRPRAKSGMCARDGDEFGHGDLVDTLLTDKDKDCKRMDFAKRFSSDAAVPDVLDAPEWPIKIELRQLSTAINTAHHFGKVPLVVCNGVDLPERFLMYSCEGMIDARQILSEVYFQKVKTVKQMQDELQLMLLQSMETHGCGMGLHIRMGTTACSFKGTFCAPGVFPAEIFGGSRRWNEEELRRHFPDPMILIQPGFNLIVSTGYGLDEARLHLPKALPYFEELAIIEIIAE